jgi:hypothetical protein
VPNWYPLDILHILLGLYVSFQHLIANKRALPQFSSKRYFETTPHESAGVEGGGYLPYRKGGGDHPSGEARPPL